MSAAAVKRAAELEAELAAAKELIRAMETGGLRPAVEATRRQLADKQKLERYRTIALGGPADIAAAIRGFNEFEVAQFVRDLDRPAARALLAHLVTTGDKLERKLQRGWNGGGFADLAAEVACELTPTDAVPRYVAITAPRGALIDRTSVSVDAAEALEAAGFDIEDTTAVPTGSWGRMGPVPREETTHKMGALRFEGPFHGVPAPAETMLASAWEVLLEWHPLVREAVDQGRLVITPLTDELNRQILGRQLVARARGGASGGIAAARPVDVLAPYRPKKEPAPAAEVAPAPEPAAVPAAEPPPPPRPRLREVAARAAE